MPSTLLLELDDERKEGVGVVRRREGVRMEQPSHGADCPDHGDQLSPRVR